MLTVTKRTLALGLAAVGLAASAGLATGALTQAPGIPLVRGATKITLCHATSSETNPFVQISVDDDSIVRSGHGDHPDDIIPPFTTSTTARPSTIPGRTGVKTGRRSGRTAATCRSLRSRSRRRRSRRCRSRCSAVASTTTARPSTPSSGTRTRTRRKSRSPWGRETPSPRTPENRNQPATFTPGTVSTAVTVTGNTGSTVTLERHHRKRDDHRGRERVVRTLRHEPAARPA